jgi:hypothetical protein
MQMARTNMSARPPSPPPLQKDTTWEFDTKYPIKSGTDATIPEIGALILFDLPDELLLLIISKLLAIRLDQPQSLAFKDRRRETDRQYENYYRRSALYALCLTSKRLNRLAVPTLYDAIAGSTTSYGINPLRLVWRTLTEKEELRAHVQYIENLLEDCLGNKLIYDIDYASDFCTRSGSMHPDGWHTLTYATFGTTLRRALLIMSSGRILRETSGNCPHLPEHTANVHHLSRKPQFYVLGTSP